MIPKISREKINLYNILEKEKKKIGNRYIEPVFIDMKEGKLFIIDKNGIHFNVFTYEPGKKKKKNAQ